jgi:hypothetical protein
VTDPRPFRLRVLDAITAALEAVSTDDGYTVNLADSVFRGRAVYGENDPLPMVSIIEDPRAVEQMMLPGESPGGTGTWTLLIQGWVEDDLVHPTDPAYFLAADVARALVRTRLDRRNLLGLGYKAPCVTEIRLGEPVVRPPDEISTKAYFWIPLILSLAENHEQPFT